MLEIILVGGAVSALYKLAKNNGLVGWVWGLLTVAGYLGGAFVVGIILFMVAPNLLDDRLVLSLLGIGAGGLGILVVYLLLRLRINRMDDSVVESDLLDDDV
jgi:hypothetical protein